MKFILYLPGASECFFDFYREMLRYLRPRFVIEDYYNDLFIFNLNRIYSLETIVSNKQQKQYFYHNSVTMREIEE